MSEEHFTLIVTSNKEHTTKVFNISKTWLYCGVGALFVAFFAVSFIIVDYSQLLVQQTYASHLEKQNKDLQAQVKKFSERMEVVQVDLEKINRFSRKLRLITSGENESDKQLELDLGKPIIDETDRGLASLKTSSSQAVKSSTGLSFPLFKKSNTDYTFLNPITEADLTLAFEKTELEAKKVERDITILFERIASKRDLLAATPSIRPTGGWVSSGFGYRKDPFTGRSRLHKGMDFAANRGTPIYAPAAGVVSFAGREGGYGKIVSIDHGYGIVTRYAHNSRLHVKTGQRVKRWDKISEVGSTGRSSGPHLHYEVRVNGVPVDPEKYILAN